MADNNVNDNTEEQISFKYSSHEEAEKGYRHLERLLSTKDEENRKLLAETEAKYKAPDEYIVGGDLSIDESIKNELDNVAKSAGLTQNQYNKLAEQYATRNKLLAEKQAEEQARQEESIRSIDNYSDKKQKLEDYLVRNYSEKMANIAKQKLGEKEFFNELWSEREKKLNTSVASVEATTVESTITVDDIVKIREKIKQYPHIEEYREQYLNLLSRKAKINKNIG